MKILFTNCWQAGNTGDNAIWKNLMRRLREKYQNCEFTIISHIPTKWDMEQLKEYNPSLVSWMITKPFSHLINAVKSENDIIKLFKKPEDYLLDDALQALKNSDVVISQGGGYMIGQDMWRQLAYFFAAQLLGKKTFFATQTFTGQIDNSLKLMIKMVMNECEMVFPREEASYNLLKEVGVDKEKLTLIPDQVFDIEPEPYNKELPKDAIKIGIRSYLASKDFLGKIAKYADMIIETFGKVVFIPIGHDIDHDDRVGIDIITSLMEHKEKAILIKDKVTAGQLMTILKDGILVSDRYHGNVFALSMGTPIIPLTPDIDFKMPGLLKWFEYPIQSVFDNKTITADELFQRTLQIYNNKSIYRDLLTKKLPTIKKLAHSIYDIIVDKIGQFPPIALKNKTLKKFTSYLIGGKTPIIYIVSQKSDFKDIPDDDLRNAYILGRGTNILVSDKGVDNPVIKIEIKKFILDDLNSTLTIGAGYNLNQAAKQLAELGYKGLTHLSGIPGTIGGAIYMNAGASHGTISDYLISVETFNKFTREQRIFTKEDCHFDFRKSIFQNSDWIITFATFGLVKGDSKTLLDLYEKVNKYRQTNYPLTFPSAGCWFRRDWGGQEIIKKIGMVGKSEGEAVVSAMFPAFILNTGNATAKDVYSLVKQIQTKAKEINEEMPCEIIIWGNI